MGGDSFFLGTDSLSDDGSSVGDQSSPLELTKPNVSSGDERGFNTSELENNGSGINEESGLNFQEFWVCDSLAAEKQRQKICAQILMCYEGSQPRINWRVYDAKSKILRYKPGSWVDREGEHIVPDTTTLLLIGPKGSGKSSLVNKISRAFDDDAPSRSDRAPVSYNSCPGDGTYFLHEYMIPKGSGSGGSLCLYDTRSFSFDSSENQKMLERWMTKGVCHGELVARKSDDTVLKAQLMSKARRSACCSRFKTVNGVIFVINGVSVLESIDENNEKKRHYLQMIAGNFKNPLVSFKDDKPVVVVTHGDLLTVSDRVRVRVFLGDLLSVDPRSQIFDIPEKDGLDTKLEIFEMLLHCLEHADINLPAYHHRFSKVRSALAMIVVFAILVMISNYYTHLRKPVEEPPIIEWHTIRHLWSD